MPRHYEDFSGKVINGIIIKGLVENSGGAGKHKKWICECPECHNEFITQSNHIKTNKTSKCFKCNITSIENLEGLRFGHLVVTAMIKSENGKRTKCLCKCDCGSKNIEVQANHLKAGCIRSCGCVLSFGEEKIASILSINNIKFEKQKTFPELKYKNILRCDFYLPDFNLIIEYNGEQHYKAVELYGGEEGLKTRQERDKIKYNYCINNHINYLVIRYDENIEDVLIANNIIMKR